MSSGITKVVFTGKLLADFNKTIVTTFCRPFHATNVTAAMLLKSCQNRLTCMYIKTDEKYCCSCEKRSVYIDIAYFYTQLSYARAVR